MAYKLGPVESNDITEDNDKIKQILQSFENRFTSIEKQLSSIKEKVGGSKIEWPI